MAWTEERRKKQSESIRKYKPWQKSTGPKTLAGKNTSKMNAHKHGARSAIAARLRAVLRRHSIFLKAVDAHWKKQNLIARYKISTNELIAFGEKSHSPLIPLPSGRGKGGAKPDRKREIFPKNIHSQNPELFLRGRWGNITRHRQFYKAQLHKDVKNGPQRHRC